MGNTRGYISGALSGLALLSCLGYTLENTKAARDALHDTQSSLVRTLEKPKGYLGEGNLLEVLANAGHDLVQRNVPSFEMLDIGIGNTPYQDQKLNSSQYAAVNDWKKYLDEESSEQLAISQYLPSGLRTKGEFILALSGAGLGLLSAAGIAKKRLKE